MGHLTDLIDRWAADQPVMPPQTGIAAALGVSRQSLLGWREGGTLPRPEHVAAVAALTGAPYVRVLDAAMTDAGYLPGPGASTSGTLVEVRRRRGASSPQTARRRETTSL